MMKKEEENKKMRKKREKEREKMANKHDTKTTAFCKVKEEANYDKVKNMQDKMATKPWHNL